ncbi:MAG: HD domain-containing protein, partial [Bacillota bacterium]|nr:HD domain-containing protein [Bacillota bacterium]
HSYIVMLGGPIIVFGSSLFWCVSDLMNSDIFCLRASGAIWMIAAQMLASIAMIVIQEHIHSKDKYEKKEINLLEISSMVYFLILLVANAMITGAVNMQTLQMGSTGGMITISLSAMLLIIPMMATMPRISSGLILLVVLIASLFIPFAMPGAEAYSFMAEIVLRCGLVIGYVAIWNRTGNAFLTERNLLKMKSALEDSSDEVIDLLINAVEIRDTESGEHTKKVRSFTRILATEIMKSYPEYGLTEEAVEMITRASGMHDIGKIMIPDEILLKPGKLDMKEWEVMKTHSEKGYELLEQAPKAWGEELTKLSRDICLYHHEKYDGRGYPIGLEGEDIPIWAQIVSVADCYEALTGERSYKKAYTPETAYEMLMIGECGAFSGKILDCLTKCKDEFAKEVREEK